MLSLDFILNFKHNLRSIKKLPITKISIMKIVLYRRKEQVPFLLIYLKFVDIVFVIFSVNYDYRSNYSSIGKDFKVDSSHKILID
jgi:hypothetical protein